MTRDEALAEAVRAANIAQGLAGGTPPRSGDWAAVAQAWAAIAAVAPDIEAAPAAAVIGDRLAETMRIAFPPGATNAAREAIGMPAPPRSVAEAETQTFDFPQHEPVTPPVTMEPGTLNTCKHCGGEIKVNLFGVWFGRHNAEVRCVAR